MSGTVPFVVLMYIVHLVLKTCERQRKRRIFINHFILGSRNL